MADEIFLTGTAAELVPVRSIDDHELGEPGEITRVIQAKFEDALHGRAEEYLEWLDPVGEPRVRGEDRAELPAPRPPSAVRGGRPARLGVVQRHRQVVRTLNPKGNS